MASAGIPETIVKSILCCPGMAHKDLSKNILLTGGNANMPGFKERVYTDVRSLLPSEFNVAVHLPEEYAYL